jgi:hypothetical protein
MKEDDGDRQLKEKEQKWDIRCCVQHRLVSLHGRRSGYAREASLGINIHEYHLATNERG